MGTHRRARAGAGVETTFIAPDIDVATAGEQLLKCRRDALSVVDADGTAVGVPTDRDLLAVLVGLHRPLR